MKLAVIRPVLMCALLVGYLWMAHQSATASNPSALVIFTGFIPLSLMLGTWSWRTHARYPVLAGLACLFATLHVFTPQLMTKIVWVYFIQDLSCNVLASAIFALSLRPSSEALITRLARMVRSHMTPAVDRYTRGLTYAWAIFFAACALLSVVLFLSGHIAAWSWFANVINLPLVGVMFVVDHFMRFFFIPKADRSGVIETIRSLVAYGERRV